MPNASPTAANPNVRNRMPRCNSAGEAPSAMTGECLTTLVRLMEAHPDAGIIQTAPRAVGHETLHGRVQQFAARAYGPLFTAGMFRGNIVMKGYLKNEKATTESFAGGWFHTGDLAVLETDRYVKIRDRSKDVIISGGENISSLEVEDVLYRHPAVLAAAVVAQPDAKWGETPWDYYKIRSQIPADQAFRPEKEGGCSLVK